MDVNQILILLDCAHHQSAPFSPSPSRLSSLPTPSPLLAQLGQYPSDSSIEAENRALALEVIQDLSANKEFQSMLCNHVCLEIFFQWMQEGHQEDQAGVKEHDMRGDQSSSRRNTPFSWTGTIHKDQNVIVDVGVISHIRRASIVRSECIAAQVICNLCANTLNHQLLHEMVRL